MTLVLTLAHPNYVVQVADRRVTTDGVVFDSASNKSLIYLARNAIVTIGYCGLAYLQGIPTDEWIAQTLWGEELLRREDGRLAGMCFAAGRQGIDDIGRSIDQLRKSVQAALQEEQAPLELRSLQIICAGWQWRRRGRRVIWRPILNIIRSQQKRGAVHCEADGVPRHWHYERSDEGRLPFIVLPLPFHEEVFPGSISGLLTRLKPIVHRPEESRKILIEYIQQQAVRDPTVGKDCMSVYVKPPNIGVVEASYISVDVEPLVVLNEKQRVGSFSPWIIGPSSYHAPQVSTGKSEAGLGPYTVQLQGPPPSNSPKNGLFTASLTQTRRPKPT